MSVKSYDKLVRDKIPDIIKKAGVEPVIRVAKDLEEYLVYLKKKVVEEAKELNQETNIEKLKKEIADVVEVLDNLISTLDLTWQDIDVVREEKNHQRGSFKDKIISSILF